MAYVRHLEGKPVKQTKPPALQRLLTIARHHQSILTVSVVLSIYVALVSWQAYKMRDQINPDAISYIRNAQYLTEARFADSVSGLRSPLISWCMAPLLYFGLDGLYSARVVLASSRAEPREKPGTQYESPCRSQCRRGQQYMS